MMTDHGCRPGLLFKGVLALVLAGCSSGDAGTSLPGDVEDAEPFAGLPADQVLRFAGTEPFWGGRVGNGRLLWSTPENIEGEEIAVERFDGRGGASFSGQLQGQPFDLTVTPGECSDGMSDLTYPFVATVRLGEEVLEGCAWPEGEEPEGPA